MNHNKAASETHDHSSMHHSAQHQPEVDHANMDHGQMDYSQHSGMDHAGDRDHSGHAGHHMAASTSADNPDLLARNSVDEHLASEYGPGVDMRAETPVAMLDDPGIGLRNNGRRVLTYADLSWPDGLPDTLEVDREITLHLTGNMSRYMWSFNGIAFADAEPLILHYGERVRIWLVNDTMMHHPIHLHGLWSDLETGDGRLARKHTVVVKPGEKLSYLVRADTRGRWAYHCHLLYHMEAGMFREVRVV
jgi:FtsP/CotA-like multicopper oxidase with cupredoxin domain